MRVVDDQRHRARPAAAGQTLGQGAHVGHVVAGLVGTLDRQGQRMALLAALDRGQTLDRPLVQGAGRQAIDGLRGKGDDLAFDQGLNRLVNHVAQIICVPEINHDGWHSSTASKSFASAASLPTVRNPIPP